MGIKKMDKDAKALYSSLIKLRDMTKNDRMECIEDILKKLQYEKEIETYQFDAFLVKAIDKCFKESREADIALMAFGLLQKYEYNKITITNRREKYLDESDYLEYNPRSKIKVFTDANKEDKAKLVDNLRKGPEDSCIVKLAVFLIEQGGIKRFINEIGDYIEDDNDKHFVKLPKLNFIRNICRIQNDYAEDNDSENVQDNGQKLAGKESDDVNKPENKNDIRSLQRDISGDILLEEIDPMPDMPKIVTNNNEKDSLEENITTDISGDGDTLDVIPPPSPSVEKKDTETKIIRLLFCVLIVLIVIAAILAYAFAIRPLQASKNAPSINSIDTGDVSPISESPMNDKLMKKVVSFDVEQKSMFIELVPKQFETIQFKDLNPADANIATLKFEPSVEGIITIENGGIKALNNVAEGNTQEVFITISAEKCSRIISVTVTNPILPDDTDSPIGNGQNK